MKHPLNNANNDTPQASKQLVACSLTLMMTTYYQSTFSFLCVVVVVCGWLLEKKQNEERARSKRKAEQTQNRNLQNNSIEHAPVHKKEIGIKNTSNHQDGVFTDYRYILCRTHIPIVRRRCICLHKRACYTRSDSGRKRLYRVQR